MDELLKRAREELEPPWDDMREARVLSRVLDEAQLPQVRRWRRPAAFAAALVVTASAAVFFLVPRSPAPQPPAVGLSVPVPSGVLAEGREDPAASGRTASVLALADGSKAQLQPGAEVESIEQSAKAVRLSQSRGVVRYEVKPDPSRPFSIAAHGVEVRVIGTIFTVAVEGDAVHVSVERGRVAVTSGRRAVELSPGENVRLSRDDGAAAPGPAAVIAPAPSELAKSVPAPSHSSKESPASLMREADSARQKGDLASAEELYGKLVRQHGASAQAASAAFSLGRVQRARGNFASAARTFDALRRRLPTSPLAEDALAEAANAWALAGDRGQARQLAAEYSARYPSGPHSERMRRLGAP